jgi:hypothetical protein
MTRDDIVRMALKAGISVATSDNWIPIIGPATIERFFKLAYEAGAKDEREACAKVCEARYMGDNNREDAEARRCAAAIRAQAADRLARHGIQLPDEDEEYGNPSF